ncbi:IS110 family transposase [Streptomyces europaeiscabiei]|uniref:IS110 family transposase n=1 Tax=Streptomyces europaeiscabiei TaxID=146819 RepID=UPI002E2D3E88|nr:transposase [Streptomyces europaeiscabiei]
MAREVPAALLGLARSGCAAGPVSGHGLTQQRRVPAAVPEVGVSAVDVLSSGREERTPVILLGVDPHKSTHTVTAVDPASNQQAGSLRIDANLADYRRLSTWGRRWQQRKGVVENVNGLGRHPAQWLVARSETVVDVPASATSPVRQLTRGGGRKNDRIDAAAAATAHIHGDGRERGRPHHDPGPARRTTRQPRPGPGPHRQPAARRAA